MSLATNGRGNGRVPPILERSAAGDRNPWLIAVVVSLATFMQVLDTSIANVALPHMAGVCAAASAGASQASAKAVTKMMR